MQCFITDTNYVHSCNVDFIQGETHSNSTHCFLSPSFIHDYWWPLPNG